MTGLKRCRMGFATAIVAAIVLVFAGPRPSAQSTNPSLLPLLTEGGIRYVGGFRPPPDAIDGNSFTYGGSPIAFNPVNRSLFVGAVDGKISEISIPVPVNTSDAKAMPASTYVQRVFADATEGRLRDVSQTNTLLYGLMVYGNRLIGAVSIYYDAENRQRRSHFSRSLNLSEPSFSGWSQVWESERSGFVGGWMSLVPPEWRQRLGGPAITGQCCIPIIARTSYGPAAFSFDPALVGRDRVPAQPLLYYDARHTTLGRWEDTNENFGIAARVGGVAIIDGTRTAIFVGSNGTGAACYGHGTADKSLVGKSDSAGVTYCYDPVDSNKGTHSYPYRYQVWAYDLNDFAAVKSGSKDPWDLKPYGVWPMTFPTTAGKLIIGGVTYDAQTQTLYVSQRDANRGEFTQSPVIHAFTLSAQPTR